jgi:uncharacterized protein YjbI with pentapeptide repeats
MQDFGSIAGGFSGGLPGSAAGGLPGGTLADGSGFDMDRVLMAERLGLVMARRAAEILDRHRESLAPDARPASLDGTALDGTALEGTALEGTALDGTALDGTALDGASPGGGADRFALDDAIFTAVLDATNECLGRFDSRPPADRWCDALLHLLDLAGYAEEGS